MEVHHHPHVEKKNFKEYLLEGLMIFLAVSMGFIAENIRENVLERETEKRNMALIVNNLKEDTVSLGRTLINKKKALIIIDSLMSFRNMDINESKTFSIFYALFDHSQNTNWFRSNQSGLEQMKSSGSLRLVKKKSVLDSLYRYEKTSKSIELYNGDADRDLILKALEAAGHFMVFDFKNPRSFNLTLQKDAVNSFYNYYFTVSDNYKTTYIPQLQKQLDRAKRLIVQLQVEYHIENE